MKTFLSIKVNDEAKFLFNRMEEVKAIADEIEGEPTYNEILLLQYSNAIKLFAWASFRIKQNDGKYSKEIRSADRLEYNKEKGTVDLIKIKDDLNIFDKIQLTCDL